jgi:hypothetical protein
MAEHLIVVQAVAGSSPVIHPHLRGKKRINCDFTISQNKGLIIVSDLFALLRKDDLGI